MICLFKDQFKNVKYLGEGAFRKAYTFGNNNECVIKISHFSDDNHHNLNEAITWNHLPKDVKKHFVPVLDYDKEGKWLIMPRVKSLELNDKKRMKIQEDVMNSIKKKGIWCDDIHIYNVGLNKYSKPVILDYGFGCRDATESDIVAKRQATSIWDYPERDFDFSKMDFFGGH